MNARGLHDDLGIMSPGCDGVQVPLQRGCNELVVAVPEYSGGWAFWARLDAVSHDEFPRGLTLDVPPKTVVAIRSVVRGPLADVRHVSLLQPLARA
jgi:hypothetical protein